MKREDVIKKVIEMLTKYKKSDLVAEQITEKTTLLKDLNMNSARLVDVILDFEDAFSIQIKDEEADSVNTVGDCVELILRKAA
ncbi:MAG: phosphopantetheine-binding protein [Desulfobacterales bacterium]|nr:phosphopantetheine-binding protein [Desulfobacterales bacterium]